MENNCTLCAFHTKCAEGTLSLFAGTPILRRIVASHLREADVPFRLEGDLFRVAAKQKEAIDHLRHSLSEAERADIRVSAGRGGELLAAMTLDGFGRTMDGCWFEEALRNDEFTVHFQPIVDTRGGLRVFAHECLIRLLSGERNGGEIIDEALARGRVHLFDSYARRLSIRKAAEQFVPGTRVFINFMPSSIYDPAFCMASALQEMSKTSLQPADIVFEVVESDAVTDMRHLKKICDYYRKEGFGFALDDVGTGTSSLQMVCELKPDYIKLDKSFISGMEQAMYRDMVSKLAEVAHGAGIEVIAEGIETAETMERVRAAGIHLMQGWLFGKPGPLMAGEGDVMTRDLIRLGNAAGPAVSDCAEERSVPPEGIMSLWPANFLK